MSEERYVDKSKWGEGPWQEEPDKKHWIDPATGLDCLIVRNFSGALCGYVGIPEGHPWHGKGYDDIPYEDVEVHFGLTFADECQEGGKICHPPGEAANEDVWWIGFDCAHHLDMSPSYNDRETYPNHIYSFLRSPEVVYRDIPYVMGHVTNLASQVVAASKTAQLLA